MRVIFFVAAATAAVLIAVRPAQAQAIPDLNVDPVCHGIAQQAPDPSEKGGPDLAFSKCVQSEQAMRQTRQRMVDIFADGKVQLHRRANGRNGELHRSRQLPGNGERRSTVKSRQVSKSARFAAV